MTPVPTWPTELRTNRLRVMGGAHTACIQPSLIALQLSRLFTIIGSPQKPYLHVGRQCAAGGGKVT
jgi:hypothetical protein